MSEMVQSGAERSCFERQMLPLLCEEQIAMGSSKKVLSKSGGPDQEQHNMSVPGVRGKELNVGLLLAFARARGPLWNMRRSMLAHVVSKAETRRQTSCRTSKGECGVRRKVSTHVKSTQN